MLELGETGHLEQMAQVLRKGTLKVKKRRRNGTLAKKIDGAEGK